MASAARFQIDTGNTLTTSLVSYWKEDNNSNDFVGTNNGTETTVSHPAGKVGNCVQIDGTGTAGVQYTSNFSMSTAGATLAFWVYIPSTRSGQVDLITDQGGTGLSEIYTNASNVINWFDGTNNNVLTSSTIAYNNAWHLVILIIKSTTAIDCYVDNVLASYTGLTVASGNVGYLSRNNATFNANTCRFDEIGEWSKIISSQEAADLWNGGAGQTMMYAVGGRMLKGIG